MDPKSVELININDAKKFLSSGGLDQLATIICTNKTVNIGSRTYITRKQFEGCMKKEALGLVRTDKINYMKQPYNIKS